MDEIKELKELMEILGALFEKQDEPKEEPTPAPAEAPKKNEGPCKCDDVVHRKLNPVAISDAVSAADYYYALLKRLNELGVPEELAHQIVIAEASA